MTAINLLTNHTRAFAVDSGLWGDSGGGPGSSQDENAPIEDPENRARRCDSQDRGFSIGKGTLDLSAAGTHVGIWVRSFQPSLTNAIKLKLGGGGTPDTNPRSEFNFAGADYPKKGPWLRLWLDVSRVPDLISGTLDLAAVAWIGANFDMGNVSGTSPNVHLARIDYGTQGIELSGAAGTFTSAEVLDAANALEVIGGGILNGKVVLKNGTFSDSNFSYELGFQPLAAVNWISILLDNTDAGNSVTWSGTGWRLKGISVEVTGTVGALDLGAGTLLEMPAVTWNASVIFAGNLSDCGDLTTGGADLRGASANNTAIIFAEAADPGTAAGFLAGFTFRGDGAGHGLVLTAATPDAITLTDNAFDTSFATADGGTGNEAIYVQKSAGTVTFTLSGTTQANGPAGRPSVRTDGAAVVFITDQVSLTIGSNVPGALVLVYDQDSADPQDLGTELLRVAATTGVDVFQYDQGKAGDLVAVRIVAPGYRPLIRRSITLPAADSPLDLTLEVETN
jgi:hypothetical protein